MVAHVGIELAKLVFLAPRSNQLNQPSTPCFSTFKGIAFQGLPTMTIMLFGPTSSLLLSFLIKAPRFLFQDFSKPPNVFVSGTHDSGLNSHVFPPCPQPCSNGLFQGSGQLFLFGPVRMMPRTLFCYGYQDQNEPKWHSES